MKKTFWVVETQGPSYLGVTKEHNFVWTLDILEALKFWSELSAMNVMFAIQKLNVNFFPAAPYATEHAFFEG